MQNVGSSDVLKPAYKTTGSYGTEVRSIDTRRGQDLTSTRQEENGGCRMLANSAGFNARAILGLFCHF
jgi:hypothetical protein